MRHEQKFFLCKHCGNLVGMVQNAGVEIICCGEPMQELQANTMDAAVEKHVPVVSVKDDVVNVKIGEVPHPMTDEHSILWVYMLTEKGGQRKCLKPGDEPEVQFVVVDDKPVSVYAYCDLHGLWKSSV